MSASTPDQLPLASLQRRVVTTLISSQILGGVGVSAGLAVGTLLAQDVSGSTTYAGLGGTFQVLGSALLAIPMARIMAGRGRRPGLIFGYGCALLGALGLIAAALTRNFGLLLVASVLFGGASASNSQSSYAAADLAAPERRGRDLSLVVWATTIGAVLGPNLVGPAEPVARALHLPTLAGPYAFSCAGLVLAIAMLWWRLRPDPLLEARRRTALQDNGTAPITHGSIASGLRLAGTRPAVLLGFATTAIGHAVMVSVMVMTPVHMREGHAELTVIGLVLSIHIFGMYAASPLVGWATDRLGGAPVALIGALILAGATVLASTSVAGESTRLTIALGLLGLGWSATLVSGSTLVTNAITPQERPSTQGATTLLMGVMGGGGGALAGVVVDHFDYHVLALGATCLALALAGLVLVRGWSGASRPTI